MGLPWWLSGKEPACQCRRRGFNPWSGKIPRAAEQLSPCATNTEPLWTTRETTAMRSRHTPCSPQLGEGGDRGWDGCMASLTQWTWARANSGRWRRTGKPGMLAVHGVAESDTTWWLKTTTTTRETSEQQQRPSTDINKQIKLFFKKEGWMDEDETYYLFPGADVRLNCAGLRVVGLSQSSFEPLIKRYYTDIQKFRSESDEKSHIILVYLPGICVIGAVHAYWNEIIHQRVRVHYLFVLWGMARVWKTGSLYLCLEGANKWRVPGWLVLLTPCSVITRDLLTHSAVISSAGASPLLQGDKSISTGKHSRYSFWITRHPRDTELNWTMDHCSVWFLCVLQIYPLIRWK